MIKLTYPLRDIQVTQPFGVSFTWYNPEKKKYVDFYKDLGYSGHMGTDFMAKGAPALATHNGKIQKAYFNKGAGNYVEIIDETYRFSTGYCHLERIDVKVGDKVTIGKPLGPTDNTGIYTTGGHLHFEMKLLDAHHNVINKDNGYGGCVDPAPYFENQYGKKWYEPAAYHRYGRKQDYLAEFNMRFKNAWLHRKLGKQLNKIYDTKFINKLIYGAWSFEEALSPGMNHITDHLTKEQYKRGFVPFK